MECGDDDCKPARSNICDCDGSSTCPVSMVGKISSSVNHKGRADKRSIRDLILSLYIGR